MQGRIVLAGGGSAKDSRALDEMFAGWIAPGSKVLYLPLALRGMRPLEDCLAWFRATFSPLQLENVEMWTGFGGHAAGELFSFAAIYIGGGNTYSLLAQCLESGFDRHLRAYASRGGIIYGGSAGAAILGKDIRTVRHIDHNQVRLTESKGLNLANGHSVWVHYKPEDDGLIWQYVRQNQGPVLALSERAGVVVDEGGMHTAGFEPALLFDEAGKRSL